MLRRWMRSSDRPLLGSSPRPKRGQRSGWYARRAGFPGNLRRSIASKPGWMRQAAWSTSFAMIVDGQGILPTGGLACPLTATRSCAIRFRFRGSGSVRFGAPHLSGMVRWTNGVRGRVIERVVRVDMRCAAPGDVAAWFCGVAMGGFGSRRASPGPLGISGYGRAANWLCRSTASAHLPVSPRR